MNPKATTPPPAPLDLVAVIRSAGERTTEFCLELLSRQVPAEAIHVVAEVPFEAALRRCFDIGARSSKKWMLTLDADTLLLPGAVTELVAAAEAMPDFFFQVGGRVYDHVFGIYRQAGHRLYRASLLAEAQGLIPPDGKKIRPESVAGSRMGERGHPSHQIALVAGLHDFGQSYRDLYRKSLIHGVKNRDLAAELLCRRLARPGDADFAVAERGFAEGLVGSRQVAIDLRLFEGLADRVLEELGLEEKPALDPAGRLAAERWMDSLLEHEPPPAMQSHDLYCDAGFRPLWHRLARQVKRRGFAPAFRHGLGQTLVALGQRLRAKD